MQNKIWVPFLALAMLALIVGCSDKANNPMKSGSESLLKAGSGGTVTDADTTYGPPWVNHAAPWTFLFGNSFDEMHQLKTVGNGRIVGFMYIMFTVGDTAEAGTDIAAWNVNGIPSHAHWDTTLAKWVVPAGSVPTQPGYVFWWPMGDVDSAMHMDSAPGFFLKHTARFNFYYLPQDRMVLEGIDFGFPHNYVVEGSSDPPESPDTTLGPHWVNHAAPWTFMFGNSFDQMHQLKKIGNGGLTGFMFVSFTQVDTADVGTDAAAWNVHGIPSTAHWDSTQAKWIVQASSVPKDSGYVFWWPMGNLDDAMHASSADGFFLKHIARFSFYYLPQNRMVIEGVDFGFPHNYLTE